MGHLLPFYNIQAGRYFRPSTGSRDTSMYSNFKPTRGHMLVVFSRIDEDQNGIVTETEFLACMVDLGVSVQDAHSVFQRYALLSAMEVNSQGDGAVPQKKNGLECEETTLQ
jgi:hypothetical protein